jgi:DNA-binding NarL/FixJ family response regulator
MKNKKPPEKIYLRWTEESIDPYDEVGITGCDDKINDGDIEYVKKEKQDATHFQSASHLLTERQKEVLIAYSKYGLGKTAAKSLGITLRTFRNHCTTIYLKLDVHNMTQAIVKAFRAGILE